MLDITIIWFPLLKGIITVLLIYGAYYFFTSNRRTIGYWYTILLVAFWIFAPIKYDGTNSVKRNVETQKIRTQQYREVSDEKKVYETKKLTFDERMKVEEERSGRANSKIKKEIIK